MKKSLKNIPILLVFLAGLALLFYPLVANKWNSYRQEQLTVHYTDAITQLVEEGKIDYKEQWDIALTYNKNLIPSILPDSFSVAEKREEASESYTEALNLAGDGMMGTIEIPKIGVSLPIFHTTEPEVLDKAVGHLEGSSLPCGGENTHSVLSAHRGLPSATLFTDLDKVKLGDHFLLHILDDTLCYEVDQILTVEPDDTSALMVEQGSDLVTLLTCTPYGINSHRLLVRGHRVPYVPEVISEDEKNVVHSVHTNYLLWVVIGLTVTVIAIVAMVVISSRMVNNRDSKKDGDDPE